MRLFLRKGHYQCYPEEFLMNHARSGITLALQSLGLNQDSYIGVLAYNCHTVFNSVIKAGCKPIFIDINNDLEIDREDLFRKRPRLSAIIVTHLFGIENDIESIKKQYPDLPIIEDCAHAYGKQSIAGDFAVFSIGQGKLPSIGDGGILIVNNRKYLDATKQLYSKLPEYSVLQSIKLFLQLAFKSFLYKPLIYNLFTLQIKKYKKSVSSVENFNIGKMSKGIQAIYSYEKPLINDMILKRRSRAVSLQIELGDLPFVSKTFIGSNAFMVVALCNTTALKHYMQEKHVETATHFGHWIEWAKECGYQTGNCPNSEKLTMNLLMIPTYR